ncbi:hypothetical protein [Streptomyces sp. NPDC002851]
MGKLFQRRGRLAPGLLHRALSFLADRVQQLVAGFGGGSNHHVDLCRVLVDPFACGRSGGLVATGHKHPVSWFYAQVAQLLAACQEKRYGEGQREGENQPSGRS